MNKVFGSSKSATAALLAILMLCRAPALSETPTAKIADSLVPLSDREGHESLRNSNLDKYIALSSQFVTQDNATYCGVASSVMVLNASGIDRPALKSPSVGRLWTQDNFWTAAALDVVKEESVRREGMTLDTLARLLTVHGLEARGTHCGEIAVDRFREIVTEALQDPTTYVLVNYSRQAVGQEGGGHISPIAAYDAKADAVLVLDVARARYSPMWIPTKMLFSAADTVDSSSGASRGIVICKNPENRKKTR